MMEVSSSTNNMEGIESFQGGNVTKVIQSNDNVNLSRIQSSSGPLNYSCLIEESIEPSPMECAAYEQYLHLPQLSAMWKSREWLGWPKEHLLKPALQSLEMTFRFISSVLCDSRPYIDKAEWKRRLESLTGSQLELISMLCEDDKHAPTVQLCASTGVLATRVTQEVWQRPGALPVVSRTSEESLLPRLGTWKRAEDMVARIWLAIECHMQRIPFTLGLGEPNLSGKPILEYDKICKPSYLYSFRQSTQFHNAEDHTICTTHQIFEAWLFIAQELLKRIQQRIDCGDFEAASKDCWMVERIWKLLTETQNLLLVMDPDDFLRLKHQLAINSTSIPTGAYCLRSTALRNLTNSCKELRHLVPKVMGVEADPKGGPRLQEAVMHLFHSHGLSRRGTPNDTSYTYHSGTIHLLQAFQAIEAAVKRFFFSYQQLVIVVMGSVEMKGSAYIGASDALSQMYFEPPYFPSVDGAKTFLSDYYCHYSPNTTLEGTREGLRKPTGKNNEQAKRRTLQFTIP
eukprot:Gb_00912 [translate_table: standard]